MKYRNRLVEPVLGASGLCEGDSVCLASVERFTEVLRNNVFEMDVQEFTRGLLVMKPGADKNIAYLMLAMALRDEFQRFSLEEYTFWAGATKYHLEGLRSFGQESSEFLRMLPHYSLLGTVDAQELFNSMLKICVPGVQCFFAQERAYLFKGYGKHFKGKKMQSIISRSPKEILDEIYEKGTLGVFQDAYGDKRGQIQQEKYTKAIKPFFRRSHVARGRVYKKTDKNRVLYLIGLYRKHFKEKNILTPLGKALSFLSWNRVKPGQSLRFLFILSRYRIDGIHHWESKDFLIFFKALSTPECFLGDRWLPFLRKDIKEFRSLKEFLVQGLRWHRPAWNFVRAQGPKSIININLKMLSPTKEEMLVFWKTIPKNKASHLILKEFSEMAPCFINQFCRNYHDKEFLAHKNLVTNLIKDTFSSTHEFNSPGSKARVVHIVLDWLFRGDYYHFASLKVDKNIAKFSLAKLLELEAEDRARRIIELCESKPQNLQGQWSQPEIVLQDKDFYGEFLGSQQEMVEEAILMSHCVYGYMPKMIAGDSLIFKVRWLKNQSERDRFDFFNNSTVEFTYSRHQRAWTVLQNRSFNNENPTSRNKKVVRTILKKLNQQYPKGFHPSKIVDSSIPA